MGKRGNLLEKKKGQTTIFILIAIVIIAAAVLSYIYYPEISSVLGITSENPSSFIQTCLEEEIEKSVEKLSLQGGSINPEHYLTYDNSNIEYLCYTNEYYVPCVMQQPMLKQHIENELKKDLKDETNACLTSLRETFEKKGYEVSGGSRDLEIELLPQKIIATIDYSLTLTRGSTENYKSFKVVLDNNLYELASITNSILTWELNYGDAETTSYMAYYPNLKVEKKKQTDGTTIYILTDRDKGDKFQFASRSLAWPPGYNG